MLNAKTRHEQDNRVEAEVKLVLEVIRSGVRDLLKPSINGLGGIAHGPARKAMVRREAFVWLFKEESRRVFSFPWCCEVVNLHPRILREELRREHQGLIRYLETQTEEEQGYDHLHIV
jgi:hypothetical protein